MPIERKLTRRESINAKVRNLQDQDSVFSKLRGHLSSYSRNYDVVMDIVIAKSYKQNIKSKSRQSETLVI